MAENNEMLDTMKKMMDEIKALKEQNAKPVSDEGTRLAAPAILKFKDQSGNREERSDETDNKKGLALGVARYAMAVHHSKVNPGMTKSEALKNLGFPKTADRVEKALAISSISTGGSLVPQQMAAEVIEYLRSASVVRANTPASSIVQVSSEALDIPKITGSTTGYWVAEGAAATNSNMTTGSVQLMPRKMAVEVVISKDFLRHAMNADQIVRNEMMGTAALLEDSAFLQGTGVSGQPKGIIAWTPSGNYTNANGSVSHATVLADLQKLPKFLEKNNVIADKNTCAIFMNASHKHGIFALLNANGVATFQDEFNANGTINGFKAGITNQLTLTTGTGSYCIMANMAHFMIGDSLDMSIEEDTTYTSGGTVYSASSRDQIVLRLFKKTAIVARQDCASAYLDAVTWGN